MGQKGGRFFSWAWLNFTHIPSASNAEKYLLKPFAIPITLFSSQQSRIHSISSRSNGNNKDRSSNIPAYHWKSIRFDHWMTVLYDISTWIKSNDQLLCCFFCFCCFFPYPYLCRAFVCSLLGMVSVCSPLLLRWHLLDSITRVPGSRTQPPAGSCGRNWNRYRAVPPLPCVGRHPLMRHYRFR